MEEQRVNSIGLIEKCNRIIKLINPDFKGNLGPQHLKYILTPIIVILSVIFYILGYLFLYGFYFGGDINYKPSILQVLINPIPINFKSVLVVGGIFLTIVVLMIYPYVKLRKALLNRDLEGFFGSFMIIIIIVGVFHIFITSIVGHKLGSVYDEIKLFYKVWVGPVSAFLLILSSSTRISTSFWGILDGAILSIITSFYLHRFNFIDNVYETRNVYIIILIIALYPILLLFTDKYLSGRVSKFLKLSPIIISILSIITMFILCLFKIVEYIYISLLICIVVSLILTILDIRYNVLKIFTSQFIKRFKNIETGIESENVGMLSYGLLIILIIPISIFINNIIETGKTMQNYMVSRHLEKIEYYSNDSKALFQIKTIEGNIIAHKDNIYYISTKNCELVTIKSSYVVSVPKH